MRKPLFQRPEPKRVNGILYSYGQEVGNHRPGNPRSWRDHHLTKVFEIFQLCTLRGDRERAIRALRLILSSHEWRIKESWRFGLEVLSFGKVVEGKGGEGVSDGRGEEVEIGKRLEYLRTLSLKVPSLRIETLMETLSELIRSGDFKQAFEEIDLVIHLFPYRNQPFLHFYLGLLTLHLSSSSSVRVPGWRGSNPKDSESGSETDSNESKPRFVRMGFDDQGRFGKDLDGDQVEPERQDPRSEREGERSEEEEKPQILGLLSQGVLVPNDLDPSTMDMVKRHFENFRKALLRSQ